MTDHKTWLWKKRSTEKTLVAADKANGSQRINEEEVHEALISSIFNTVFFFYNCLCVECSVLLTCMHSSQFVWKLDFKLNFLSCYWEKAYLSSWGQIEEVKVIMKISELSRWTGENVVLSEWFYSSSCDAVMKQFFFFHQITGMLKYELGIFCPKPTMKRALFFFSLVLVLAVRILRLPSGTEGRKGLVTYTPQIIHSINRTEEMWWCNIDHPLSLLVDSFIGVLLA